MPNKILTHLNYLNGARVKDAILLPELSEIKYLIWLYTGNDKCDKILNQRLYGLADAAVKHFERDEHESAIAMCATAAEMLTYVIFFIWTDSYELPSKNEFSSSANFDVIRTAINSIKGLNYENTFGLIG